jgi:hypothetical protein
VGQLKFIDVNVSQKYAGNHCTPSEVLVGPDHEADSKNSTGENLDPYEPVKDDTVDVGVY